LDTFVKKNYRQDVADTYFFRLNIRHSVIDISRRAEVKLQAKVTYLNE